MPVLINNKRLVPAPIITYTKQVSSSENGEFVGADHTFSFRGYLLATQGNPIVDSSGINSSFSSDSWTSSYSSSDDPQHGVGETDRLLAIMSKQEQLRKLLAQGTGIKVEIIGWNQNKGLKFIGNLSGPIEFSEDGRWANPCSYNFTITTQSFLESINSGVFQNNSTEDSPTYFVSDVTESWNIQEDSTYSMGTGVFSNICKNYIVTHDITAKGKLVYDESGNYLNGLKPWQQASGYVRTQGLGNANDPIGLLDPKNITGFYLCNRKIVENIDRYAGTYSINETYTYVNTGILPSGFFITEEISLSEERGEDSLIKVSINGTINGLETVAPTGAQRQNSKKYENALAYYNFIKPYIYNRVLTNSSTTWLHPQPISKVESKNPIQGQITYNYVYDNRPPNLVPGSISEDISINDTYPGQLFSVIPVIGRATPVLQYLNSRSEYTRQLSININMGPITQNWAATGVNSSGYLTNATPTLIRNWFISQKPSTLYKDAFSGIYEAVNPANMPNVVKNKVFYQAPTETWNPKTGQYSYTVTWTYEVSGV